MSNKSAFSLPLRTPSFAGLLPLNLMLLFGLGAIACDSEPEADDETVIDEQPDLEEEDQEVEFRTNYLTFTNEWVSGMAINAHYQHNGGNVNMYTHVSTDPEQDWEQTNGRLKLRNVNLCLHADGAYNGANVNVKTCSSNDPYQKWSLVYRYSNPINTYWLRLTNTNYCVNAHAISNFSNVNLWTCSSGDPDVHFEVW